ncbi:zinc finger protein Noc-like [Phymastichus coffea]|uniref:zinc finger protein Noc-like n=1 Tax=Phymastichus coffea TaxID=108790 RepID=UPI00273A9E62|nr:zinc finger protein Noc-like [Phymastichus coffea]
MLFNAPTDRPTLKENEPFAMLTSSANQYLRPEYLTPLPTTLDAKKSPLALLAQTCSQIGVDPPQSGKSMLASHDSKASSKAASKSSSDPAGAGREKGSPATALYVPPTPSASSTSSTSSTSSIESARSSSSFKPYESCLAEAKSSSPEQQQQRVSSVHSSSSSTSRSRTPATSNKRCSSNQSASSGGRAATPQGRKSSTPGEPRASPSSRPGEGAAAAPSPSRPSASLAATATTASASAATYGLPFPPQLPAMDPMSASSLMSAQHHAALKSGLAHPYMGYARMKTPGGADALVPVCRDPYCSSCQLSSQLLASAPGAAAAAAKAAAAGPCAAGCAQCDHGKSSAVAAAVAASASPAYAAYAHAQLVAFAAASQVPYVCNWIGSDAAYCGKRFATSDELLQHFRTHTGQPAGPGGDANAAAAAAATTAAALSLLTPPVLAAGHPLLSRSYPTPPLSPLASARYHPYGKPHYGAPGLGGLGLQLPPPPHALPAAAGLPPYFSPYSLYAGSRLGAASGMHP